MKTPLTLCDRLELRPTMRQREMLGVLGTCPPFYQTVGDASHEVLRAVAVWSLWRILDAPSSSGVILTGSDKSAQKMMSFLESVTQSINSNMASLTTFPRWNVLRIGGQPSWELRLLPNEHNLVRERARGALFSVVIDGKSSEPAFVEACKALEEHSSLPRHTRIVVW